MQAIHRKTGDKVIGIENPSATLKTSITTADLLCDKLNDRNFVGPLRTKAEGELKTLLEHMVCLTAAGIQYGVLQNDEHHLLTANTISFKHNNMVNAFLRIVIDKVKTGPVEGVLDPIELAKLIATPYQFANPEDLQTINAPTVDINTTHPDDGTITIDKTEATATCTDSAHGSFTKEFDKAEDGTWFSTCTQSVLAFFGLCWKAVKASAFATLAATTGSLALVLKAVGKLFDWTYKGLGFIADKLASVYEWSADSMFGVFETDVDDNAKGTNGDGS